MTVTTVINLTIILIILIISIGLDFFVEDTLVVWIIVAILTSFIDIVALNYCQFSIFDVNNYDCNDFNCLHPITHIISLHYLIDSSIFCYPFNCILVHYRPVLHPLIPLILIIVE